MSKKNVYVVCGDEQTGPSSFVLATYSNYKSALDHAKHFVGDNPEVVKEEYTIFVYGEARYADIEVYPLKEEFDNE